MIARISVDLGCGAGIAVVARLGRDIASGGSAWWPGLLFLSVVLGLVIAVVAILVIGRFLRGLASFLTWSLTIKWASPPRRRLNVRDVLVASGAAGLAGGLIFWRAGPGAVWPDVTDAVIAALPPVFVLVSGIWACLLIERRIRATRHHWVRYAANAAMAALAGLGILVVFYPDTLATLPAAGLLFPAGAWSSILTWRVMARSRRLAVRAGADIVLSLLWGAGLVLFLVWAANLLDLPRAEVAILRGTLERIRLITELPWWLWVALYVLLAGASLALALWSALPTATSRWAQRLRVVPAVGASRRALSGVHIGLLVTVLIGLAAPAPLTVTLRSQVKATYIVALQRELAAEGEHAAYEKIRQQFTPRSSTAVPVQPLAGIISKIHDISSPPPGTSDATSTERDLARRIGQLQAVTLTLSSSPAFLSAEQADARLAQAGPPVRDEGNLHDQLGQLDTQQHQDDKVTRLAGQAADLAATAVASTLQIPRVGDNEIVQVTREYLSGLVESSPLKNVFAAWARHLTGTATPPGADEMVVPDPGRLKLAALAQERARMRLADPSAPDPAQARALGESPADAAVDLINETRYVSENSGPCVGCQPPLPPGDEHHGGPGPEPPAEPPPEIPIP